MWKKLQLHALPTNKPNKIGELCKFSNRWNISAIADLGYDAYHLYLTSDEEIKESEWCIEYDPTDGNSHYFQCKDWQVSKVNTGLCAPHCRKIVATTNPDVWKDMTLGEVAGVVYQGRTDLLKVGKIPQSLIEYFVQKQGNVKEVMVEYDYAHTAHEDWERPRLTPSGEIIWKPVEEYIDTTGRCANCGVEFHIHKSVEEETYTFTRDELKERLWSAVEAQVTKRDAFQQIFRNQFEKWFDETYIDQGS